MTQTITIDADKGREIAATVAAAICRACGKIIDAHGDHADLLDDTTDAAVDAAMQALADALIPTIYKRPASTYRGTPWFPAREAEARVVYETWSEQRGFVPWVPDGNSLKQDEARAIIRRDVERRAAEALPTVPETGR